MIRPDGIELLRIARATLRDDLEPQLTGERRYAARMIANAMAIAARELADAGLTERDELQRLEDFYRAPYDERDVRVALRALEQRFAGDLRHVAFVESRDREIRKLLHARLRARLGISNPRRLEGGVEQVCTRRT